MIGWLVAEQEYLSVTWFREIIAGLSFGFLGVLSIFWAWLNRMATNQVNLEKAIIQQGARFDRELSAAHERFQQQLKAALDFYAAADVTNDELRLRSFGDQIAALKEDLLQFARDQKDNHAENKEEMRHLEQRLNDNLNERREMIEKTMREGFIQAVAAMRDRK